MPRINSKQSSTVKIQIEGQSDDSDQDEEKRTRERRGKVAKREKPSEIEVCSCPTCSRLFMRQRNEQERYDDEDDEDGDSMDDAQSDGSDDYERTARALRAEFLRDQKKKLDEEKSKIEKEQAVRADFIARKPRVVCLSKADTWLQLSVEATAEGASNAASPSPSAFPKGIIFEVQVQPVTREGGKLEWATASMPKNATYAIAHKLHPGCEYKCRSRLGLASQFTWAGSPEWKPFGEILVFKTSQPLTLPPAPLIKIVSSTQGGGSQQQQSKEVKAQGGSGKKKEQAKAVSCAEVVDEASGDEGYRQTESGQFYCKACMLTLASWQAWERHVAGVKHQKRLVMNQREEEEEVKEEELVPPPSSKADEKIPGPQAPEDRSAAQALVSTLEDFNCDLCGVRCNGPRTFEDHLISKRHKASIKALNNGQAPPLSIQVPEALAPASASPSPVLNSIVKTSPNVILVRREVPQKAQPQPTQAPPARLAPQHKAQSQDQASYADESLHESYGEKPNLERLPRKLCQCFIRGTCHFGSRCWHIHDNEARAQHLNPNNKAINQGPAKQQSQQPPQRQQEVEEEELAPAPVVHALPAIKLSDYEAPTPILPQAQVPPPSKVAGEGILTTMMGMGTREAHVTLPPVSQDPPMTSWQPLPLAGGPQNPAPPYWQMPMAPEAIPSWGGTGWGGMSLAPEPKAMLSLIGGDSFFGSSSSSSNLPSLGATTNNMASTHNLWAQAGGIGSGSYLSSFMPSQPQQQAEYATATVQHPGQINHLTINPQPYRPFGRVVNNQLQGQVPIPVPVPIPIPTSFHS